MGIPRWQYSRYRKAGSATLSLGTDEACRPAQPLGLPLKRISPAEARQKPFPGGSHFAKLKVTSGHPSSIPHTNRSRVEGRCESMASQEPNMGFRFICPHCRVALDPAAMEVSHAERSEFRVCPCCDSPVVLAVGGGRGPYRTAPESGSLQSVPGAGSEGASPPCSRAARP